jgi:uncharacterized protein YbjQ (UPF0145 family)
MDDASAGGAADRRAEVHRLPSSTLPVLPGYRVTRLIGIVGAEGVHGLGVGRDILASLTDTFGGRSGTSERGLREAREYALFELKAAAIDAGGNGLIGVAFDAQVLGGAGGSSSMLMMTATGTAVVVEPEGEPPTTQPPS